MVIFKRLMEFLAAAAVGSGTVAAQAQPPETNLQPVATSVNAASSRPDAARSEKVSLTGDHDSLYNPASANVAHDVFDKYRTVVFSERHSKTNYDFLAQNPDFFKQLADHGGRYMLAEIPIAAAPMMHAYFTDVIDERGLDKRLEKLFKEAEFSSEDSVPDMIKSVTAACKTAKKAGIEIVASDFRILMEKNYPMTSDVYGIADIEGRDDMVRDQTMIALNDWRTSTGKTFAESPDDIREIADRMAKQRESMPKEQQEIYDQQVQFRQTSPQDNKFAQFYQNERQYRYYNRIVGPEEPAMFMNGLAHFSEAGSIGNWIESSSPKNRGTVAGIALFSRADQKEVNEWQQRDSARSANHINYKIFPQDREIYDEGDRLVKPDDSQKQPIPKTTGPQMKPAFN